MRTQIRQQNGIAILEPNGKIVGPSVTKLRDAIISPQIENVRCTPVSSSISRKSIRLDGSGTLRPYGGTCHGSTENTGRIGVINVGKHIKDLVAVSRIVSPF